MKKLIYLTLIAFFALGLSSCEKETSTEDVSTYTYYVNIQLEGDATMLLPEGEGYIEPGFSGTLQEVDVTDNVLVDGTVDGDQSGMYQISYSAVGSDGFETEVIRTVIVYDPLAPEDDISGVYDGVRVGGGGGPVTITKLGPGIFEVTDLFGGYYDVVADYGTAYRLSGIIQLNPDLTYVSLTNSSPWGPWEILDGVYNPGTGVMTHTVDQDGFSFDVVLTK
jgi:hypothetical protein